jgi:5-methylcytosine-specific restriction endonuclease McrA
MPTKGLVIGLIQALDDLITFGVVGFVIIAGMSLWLTNSPEVPPFARRSPTSSSQQLRHDSNARIFYDHGFLFRRRTWFVATCCPPVKLDRNRLTELNIAQQKSPVVIVRNNSRVWWWFEGNFYWESAGYSARDVLALIRVRERRRKQQLDRAHTLLKLDKSSQRRREVIPKEVRRAVFERDGGRCAECGENFDLQYDHIIPVAHGGASTVENLQLLCGDCNRAKGADI